VRARAFADELIPFGVKTEMNGGELQMLVRNEDGGPNWEPHLIVHLPSAALRVLSESDASTTRMA
jgi:hypothetical protein